MPVCLIHAFQLCSIFQSESGHSTVVGLDNPLAGARHAINGGDSMNAGAEERLLLKSAMWQRCGCAGVADALYIIGDRTSVGVTGRQTSAS